MNCNTTHYRANSSSVPGDPTTGRRDTRPLLRNSDRRGTLERLADERRPSYAEAHIRVTSGDGAHGDVVESIIEALNQRLAGS